MPPNKKRRDKPLAESEDTRVESATAESTSTSEHTKIERPKTGKPEPHTGFIDKYLGEYRGNGMWVKRN